MNQPQDRYVMMTEVRERWKKLEMHRKHGEVGGRGSRDEVMARQRRRDKKAIASGVMGAD